MSEANNCLSDEELTRLVQGLQRGSRHDVLMLHLDICPGCRMVLSEAAQHLNARPGSWVRALAVVSAMLLALLAIWIVGTT